MIKLVKEIIEKEVFYGSFSEPISLKQIKELALEKDVTILDTDVIIQELPEDRIDYDVSVLRPVMETDQEFEARKKATEISTKRTKEYRRKHYLKLKKEFENE